MQTLVCVSAWGRALAKSLVLEASCVVKRTWQDRQRAVSVTKPCVRWILHVAETNVTICGNHVLT
jgi:hypothetical protein